MLQLTDADSCFWTDLPANISKETMWWKLETQPGLLPSFHIVLLLASRSVDQGTSHKALGYFSVLQTPSAGSSLGKNVWPPSFPITAVSHPIWREYYPSHFLCLFWNATLMPASLPQVFLSSELWTQCFLLNHENQAPQAWWLLEETV